MNIWTDLANSPHVLFFKPIICELESRGHRVYVTHRDFAQTSRLCDIFGINSIIVGNHGGQGLTKKIRNIIYRAHQLRNYAHGKNIDLAISHNSYAHCLAAKSLGLPYITMMDYEYQPANHINFRLANEILAPFTFDLKTIRIYGAKEKKLIKYPGLKEEVYLWQFPPNTNFWKNNFPAVDSDKILCSVRPPATMAAYHNFENPLFYQLMKFIDGQHDVQVIFFPRTESQRVEFQSKFPGFLYPEKPVDGAQLIANSDMIISAGGTMNREAAVLGTPAYSVYAGKMGSVDTYLSKTEKLHIISNKNNFEKIQIRKRDPKINTVSPKVFDFIINRITNYPAGI